jgi:hypothetical protein
MSVLDNAEMLAAFAKDAMHNMGKLMKALETF